MHTSYLFQTSDMSNVNHKPTKITTAQAADILGVSRATMARAAKRGEVPPGVCSRVLGQYIWDKDACREWVASADVSNASQPEPRKGRGRPSVLNTVVHHS